MKPSIIRIKPANIPRIFVEKFLSVPPKLKPKIELIKVIRVIIKAGFKTVLPYKDKDIPAENASILVAMPIKNKHFLPKAL